MDIEGILAILLIFGGGTAVALGFSPVGRAVADRIRGKHAAPAAEELRAELAEQRDAHAEELGQVRQEIAELAERLDFAERMLAQQREAPRVGPGGGER
jgi:Tfp pilus assembly protein PilO